jgi:transcriptional regulator with GAF, ATPase, and Fis domain
MVAIWHGFGYCKGMLNEIGSLKSRIGQMEREEIIKALRACNWVMARAARKLGITERMIGYRITKYGIRIKEVRWVVGSGEMRCGGSS